MIVYPGLSRINREYTHLQSWSWERPIEQRRREEQRDDDDGDENDQSPPRLRDDGE